jgi:hypothetical protein
MKVLLAKILLVAAVFGLSLLWGAKQQENVLTYTTHWVGNTFEGAGPNGYGRWVQDYVDEIEVTPDGAVITASEWDEAGRCTGIYKDGDVNRDLLKQYNGQGGHKAWGWGTASQAVAVEGNFTFIANTANELLRFRWNPNNIHEYAYIDQTQLGGDEKTPPSQWQRTAGCSFSSAKAARCKCEKLPTFRSSGPFALRVQEMSQSLGIVLCG